MKTAPVFGIALFIGSWGAVAAPDFDVHNPENGYVSDSDYIADPQVADRRTGASEWFTPTESYYDSLERAEIAAMELREPSSSTSTAINFLPGWDPDLKEM